MALSWFFNKYCYMESISVREI